ncbi:hypothetical protein ACIHDR_49100, partial [Nocardia sp. NPDC052278]
HPPPGGLRDQLNTERNHLDSIPGGLVIGDRSPALTKLLHDDVILFMPPYELWLQGRTQIERWFQREPNPCRNANAIPVKANGSQAFAIYHAEAQHGAMRAFALQVITIRHDRIAAIDIHIEPQLFGQFELPTELPSDKPTNTNQPDSCSAPQTTGYFRCQAV